MKRKILILALVIGAMTMTSCEKSWQRIRKENQFTERNYDIKQYSGGVLIAEYKFRGMLNDSDGSDGYYSTWGMSL